jgi:undecaprenyl diphosphate synthase
MSSSLLDRVRLGGDVPGHLAVIMDGNGRWARARGLPRQAGHRQGMEAVREVVEGAGEAGIPILTLFAFSVENWQRPGTEISALMALLRLYAGRERRTLCRQGVEVHVLGELERLDASTQGAIDDLVGATRGGDRLRLNLMVSYSGRGELVRAARLLARLAVAGELDPDAIDESTLESALFTHGLPDPDLLIRTSGEQRISNFLLWQLAYTEIVTSPVLWPDFTREHLFEAIVEYQGRDRRFGRVSAR